MCPGPAGSGVSRRPGKQIRVVPPSGVWGGARMRLFRAIPANKSATRRNAFCSKRPAPPGAP
eukprot:4228697-Lingulodinium_polyedra.AAC.1